LQGLSKEEVGSFIQARAGFAPHPYLVEAVHAHTEGNPLFMTQVVQLLDQQGELVSATEVTSREWSFQIPPGIQEVIGRRLEQAAVEVLGLAGSAPAPTPPAAAPARW
jgi:predicted ATPase